MLGSSFRSGPWRSCTTPDKMPAVLRDAHRELDLTVERCYRKTPFKGDEERPAYLFKEYEKMIAAEKQQ